MHFTCPITCGWGFVECNSQAPNLDRNKTIHSFQMFITKEQLRYQNHTSHHTLMRKMKENKTPSVENEWELIQILPFVQSLAKMAVEWAALFLIWFLIQEKTLKAHV